MVTCWWVAPKGHTAKKQDGTYVCFGDRLELPVKVVESLGDHVALEDPSGAKPSQAAKEEPKAKTKKKASYKKKTG